MVVLAQQNPHTKGKFWFCQEQEFFSLSFEGKKPPVAFVISCVGEGTPNGLKTSCFVSVLQPHPTSVAVQKASLILVLLQMGKFLSQSCCVKRQPVGVTISSVGDWMPVGHK